MRLGTICLCMQRISSTSEWEWIDFQFTYYVGWVAKKRNEVKRSEQKWWKCWQIYIGRQTNRYEYWKRISTILMKNFKWFLALCVVSQYYVAMFCRLCSFHFTADFFLHSSASKHLNIEMDTIEWFLGDWKEIPGRDTKTLWLFRT